MATKRQFINEIDARKTQKNTRKKTEYGIQLAEKQLAKRLYGVMERQFFNYYVEALRRQGDTGEIIQQLLETRLDNVVYRGGYAITRAQARQMVSHGMFLVNGKKVNIPSYQVKVKDEITIKPGKETKKTFADMEKRLEKYQTPTWLSLDLPNRKVRVLSMPAGKELDNLFNPRHIVEFYSK